MASTYMPLVQSVRKSVRMLRLLLSMVVVLCLIRSAQAVGSPSLLCSGTATRAIPRGVKSSDYVALHLGAVAALSRPCVSVRDFCLHLDRVEYF